MPSTSFFDPTAWDAWALQARTDASGATVSDASGEEGRLLASFYTGGVVGSGDFQVAESSPNSMVVNIGSGTANNDLAVIPGTASGQGRYAVRQPDATTPATIAAADASLDRIDELYLMVADATFDAGTLTLPRVGYRQGDAGGGAPGPDSAWTAHHKIATIGVSAAATAITDADITDERARAGLTLGGSERLAVSDTNNTHLVTPSGGVMDFLVGSTIEAFLTDTALNLQGNDLISVGDVDGDFASKFEVDESTEVASQVALTSSFVDRASVTLAIPAGWGSWKCEAWASYVGVGPGSYETRIRIDGTDQQVKNVDFSGDIGEQRDGSVGGRRTGMTTTGNRTVSLRAREVGGAAFLNDIYLYARAGRTS